ncbi:Anti-sigma-28 factor FlgM family protein [Pseudodesulfovibrio mercurii]|uniref:Negative regulator of flagellin synthesis n=1 Tax=Pseudodesulfovibrio mercurii TaxID=641491 RepID=F0JCV1_9BACT|nr:flagellar biosynthesis anti-sigma factor FlgM [Pseudodesulfovibrio mercurii]EGB13279.1 Anti-sigma-28 factor FlgM family protein [Pseudodesulfovibrio mercurii]
MVIRNIVGDQNPYANKKIERPEAKEVRRTQGSVKTSGESADSVVLSSEARLRGAALQTAKEAPDVRREKVDELKRQVKDGTYQPDLKKAAANLIRDDLDLLV